MFAQLSQHEAQYHPGEQTKDVCLTSTAEKYPSSTDSLSEGPLSGTHQSK